MPLFYNLRVSDDAELIADIVATLAVCLWTVQLQQQHSKLFYASTKLP